MNKKKHFAWLIAVLLSMFSANAQYKMHVNMKNGSTMNVFVSEIESITWDSDAEETGENNPDDPTVTGDALDVTENSATIVGYANNVRDNESTDLKIGVIYCTEGTPNKSNGKQMTVGKNQVAADGKYTINISGLGPGVTYYYRSFVYQSGLWFYGKVRSFTTTGLIFATGDATSITCFSAKVSATINTPSTVSPSEYGICYGIDMEPTNRLKVTNKDADGNITETLRALEGNTIYYYRPYAVVNSVVAYGQTSSLKTLEDNVVETGEYDEETRTVRSRLTLGGGAYSTLEVGLCWSTTELPTVDDYTVKTNELDDENYYVVQPFNSTGINYYRAYVKIDGVAHYGAVKTKDLKPVMEYVDLGLSVKWATCNVGAPAPEEYGDYYAWGETETKSTYNWSTYKWCNGSYNTLTKYCTSSSYGTVDNKKVLDPEDDVAQVKWGGNWRMPTDAEMTELRENCTWTWTMQGGKKGYKVTSKKNGNSIFLPAAGYRLDSSLGNAGSYGGFWSSSLNTSYPYCAYYVYFGSSDVDRDFYSRCYGQSVRPVCP